VVTHDQHEAMTMADSIVVMSQGRVEQMGTPQTIYHNPENAFVADFIGKANFFDGVIEGGNVRLGDRLLRVDPRRISSKGHRSGWPCDRKKPIWPTPRTAATACLRVSPSCAMWAPCVTFISKLPSAVWSWPMR